MRRRQGRWRSGPAASLCRGSEGEAAHGGQAAAVVVAYLSTDSKMEWGGGECMHAYMDATAHTQEWQCTQAGALAPACQACKNHHYHHTLLQAGGASLRCKASVTGPQPITPPHPPAPPGHLMRGFGFDARQAGCLPSPPPTRTRHNGPAREVVRPLGCIQTLREPYTLACYTQACYTLATPLVHNLATPQLAPTLHPSLPL